MRSSGAAPRAWLQGRRCGDGGRFPKNHPSRCSMNCAWSIACIGIVVELAAVSQRTLRRGSAFGLAQAMKKQHLIAGIDERVGRLGEHASTACPRARNELCCGNKAVTHHRCVNGPLGSRSARHQPTLASTLLQAPPKPQNCNAQGAEKHFGSPIRQKPGASRRGSFGPAPANAHCRSIRSS
jgi:hypothetical protein